MTLDTTAPLHQASQAGATKRDRAWRAAFYIALAAVTAYICLRNHGVYPAVFADEWYYSKMSRLDPLANALVPSYLYLWLFAASNACGTGFLECVRWGNLALYLAALPFFYGIARRYTSRGYAMLLTVLAAAAPLNVYTMYFMPEATYWFAFCLLSWIMLTRDSCSTLGTALAGGLVLGLMSLIKVHALFLVPALCLYLVYAGWQAGGTWKQWMTRGALAALAAAALTVAVKFGLGWLLAGEAGLNLLGPFYQGNVASGSTAVRMALLYPILVSALGHLMALAVMFGVPLAILLHGVGTGALRRSAAPAGRLQVYTLLMLGVAAGMAVFYTATLADRGASEAMRLHLRYYDFVFPLLWLVAAAAIGATPAAPVRAQRLRWGLAALLALLVIVAFFRLPDYSLLVVDGPEIAAINMRSTSGHVTVVLQLALLAAWASGRANAARLFVLVLLPVLVLVGQDRIASSASSHRNSQPGDRAGALALALVPPSERGRLVVAGADAGGVMRVLFHIDRADTAALLLAPDQAVPRQDIAPGARWLLVLGRHAAPFGQAVRQTDEFTLLRLPEGGHLDAHTGMR
jgi:phosphoglycerol transferase